MRNGSCKPCRGMPSSTVFMSSIGAFVLVACGASEATRHRASSGDGVTTRASVAMVERGDQASAKPRELRGVPYGDNPLLTLYVEGPDPVANLDAAAGVYETVVTVVNDGVVPAALGTALPSFEAWVGHEQRACAESEPVEVPDVLASGEAYTFVTRALCPVRLGEADDVEVRTYVRFGAPAGGGASPERHYAGRYFVR